MPVEGFDDASKNISKRGSSRRKASREANSKRIAARQAEKAKKKAAQNEFNKYATPGQKRKAARNSSVNKADVILLLMPLLLLLWLWLLLLLLLLGDKCDSVKYT